MESSETHANGEGRRSDVARVRSGGWSSRHLWQITAVQDLFWMGLAAALIWFGYYLRGVFVPILIGFGLAYTVNPLLAFAEKRWKFPRPAIIGGIIGGMVVISIIVLASVSPLLLEEIRTLSRKAPEYTQTVASHLDSELDDAGFGQLNDLTSQVPRDAVGLAKLILSNTAAALGFVSGFVSTTTYVIVSLFLIPVYFFFFAWHFNPMLTRMKQYIPSVHRDRILEVTGRMDDAVGNFLRGRLVVMLAMMFMFSVGFWLADVPYWFLLGCLTGVLSFVPYLAVIGWLLAISVTWIDVTTNGAANFDWMKILVWPTAAYGLVQLVEGWLLTPWIQSKSMAMSPVAVLIVVFVGGSVGGIYGLLLAIPIAGCTRILWEEILLPRLEAWAADA